MIADENLIGDKILPKRKKETGKLRTIYFSKVVMEEHEKKNMFGDLELHTFKSAISIAFNNFKKAKATPVEIGSETYNITLFQNDERYYLFSISLAKQFNDILAEPIDSKTKETIEKKNMMLRYYTFILTDTQAKIIAYLYNRNLPNINELLNIFLCENSKMNLYIEPLKNPKIEKTINNSLKANSLTFTVNTTLQDNISQTLDEACSITRESECYKINVSVKSPSKKMLKSILENSQKILAFQKAKINLIDENNIPQIVDIFSMEFSIKTKISIDDVDLKENEKMKQKLISAMYSLRDFS